MNILAMNPKTIKFVVNKNIHHSTIMVIEHNTTNTEFSKPFKK
jgi:hypothetical protein